MNPKLFMIRVGAALVGFAIGNKLYNMYVQSTAKPLGPQTTGAIGA